MAILCLTALRCGLSLLLLPRPLVFGHNLIYLDAHLEYGDDGL
jgi:hypothetical protein